MNAPDPGPETAPNVALEDAPAVHVVTIGARDWRTCLAAIEATVLPAAEIVTFSLQPVSDQISATLRFRRVSSQEARRIVEAMTDRPGILTARIEHHLIHGTRAFLEGRPAAGA